jgi:hypothetical protein
MITQHVLFIERTNLFDKIEDEHFDYFESKEQFINWERFLLSFKNEEEIRNLEILDLLDVDYEKLEELKMRTTDMIDVTSELIEEKEKLKKSTASEQSFVLFFSQKLDELISNEINLKIFIDNLEKVKSISYSSSVVKIFFK